MIPHVTSAAAVVSSPLAAGSGAEASSILASTSICTPAPRRDDWSKLSIDYHYVRDYPDRASRWLEAVRASTDIPSDIISIIADPLAGIVTSLLPVVRDRLDSAGVTADGLLQWASHFPGFHNDDLSDDGYRSILTYLDTAAERAASEAARTALHADHPWQAPTGRSTNA